MKRGGGKAGDCCSYQVMAEPPHVRRRRSVIVPCSQFEALVCVNDVGYEVSAVAVESVRKEWTNLRFPEC